MWKLLVAIFAILTIISCKHQKNLSEQLNDNFANHLKNINSLVTLDSVHILWNTTVTEKLGRIIDDTVYLRELMRIQAQLLRAQQKNERDSIEFYQYEKNNLEKGIDLVTKSIAQSDTTHRYGYLIGCAYYLSKNQKTIRDSTIVFIDSTSILRYTEFMDSAISRTIRRLD
jgi:hypothetical protein